MYRRENLHWFNELATISLFLAQTARLCARRQQTGTQCGNCDEDLLEQGIAVS